MAARPRLERIDQALFGYRDGHRLLSATADLSSADRRLLVRETDNPDAGRTRSWESLLSGYPLPSGRYALSMTWPAWEMPRPGCVWTHTLLLDEHALSTTQPTSLLALFCRPNGPEPALDDFAQPLDTATKSIASARPLGGPAYEWACALTWAFFDPPIRPVRATRVELEDPDRHRVLLTVWAAAWPTLRGHVSFIDAPRTPRRLGDDAFDLQLHQAIRVGKPEDDARVLSGIPKAKPPSWALDLVTESTKPDGLTVFLAAYGSDLGADRGVLPAVVEIYTASVAPRPGAGVAQSLADRLGSAFPDPASALRLKKELLGAARRGMPVTETDRLTALVNTREFAAFDSEDLEIGPRALASLTGRSVADLAEVLTSITDPKQPLAHEFVAAVSEAINQTQMRKLATVAPEAALSLVRAHPALAHDPVLWKSMAPEKLWSAVTSQRGRRQRGDLLRAIIESGAKLDPAIVTRSWRNTEPALLQALAVADADPSTRKAWLAQIEPVYIVDYLRESGDRAPKLLALALEQLDAAEIARLDPAVLRGALVADATPGTAAAVLQASRQMTADPYWAEVAILAYDRVAGFARAGELGSAVARISPEDPDLRSKDVLARVARDLNHDLRHGAWPSLAALELSDRSGFRALMAADRRAALAREVLVSAASQGTPIKAWQREVLNRSIAERADRDSLFKVLQGLGRAVFPFGG
jgi:hypothetical protein